MNERLHELREEMKNIESMLDTLSSPMLELVLEEQRNIQFELDIIQKNQSATDHHHSLAFEGAKETSDYNH